MILGVPTVVFLFVLGGGLLLGGMLSAVSMATRGQRWPWYSYFIAWLFQMAGVTVIWVAASS